MNNTTNELSKPNSTKSISFKPWVWGGMIVLVLLLAAGVYIFLPKQSISTSNVIKLPTVDKDVLLLFSTSDAKAETGDLYVQKVGSDKDKAASDVYLSQAQYLSYRHAVLFLDKNNNLYMKEVGKDKIKISQNVVKDSIVVSKDDSSIAFLQSDTTNGPYPNDYGDLYIINQNKDKDKLTSNVALKQYVLSEDGNEIAYLNRDHDFYVRQLNKPEAQKIASDINRFNMSDNGKTVAMINRDKHLSYQSLADKDKINVSVDNVDIIQVTPNGNGVAFLGDYNGNTKKGELYYISLGNDKQKLASDITQYLFSQDGSTIYLKNAELSLYRAKLPTVKKGSKTPVEITKDKVATDVNTFQITSTGINFVYINKDSSLYFKPDGKDSFKLSDSVTKVHLADQSLLFLDKEHNLNQVTLTGDKPTTQKLATDNESYQADRQLNRIVYASLGGQISTKTKDATDQTILDDANKFQRVYYDNTLLYEKKVRIEDIVGIWKPNNDQYFVEFTADQDYNLYDGKKTTNKFTVTDTTPNTITVTTNKNSEYGSRGITVVDKDTLKFSVNDWGETTFKRITADELKNTLDRWKMAQDKAEAQQKYYDDLQTQGKTLVGHSYKLGNEVRAYSSPTLIEPKAYLGKMSILTTVNVQEFQVISLHLWVKVTTDKYNGQYWVSGDELVNQTQTK